MVGLGKNCFFKKFLGGPVDSIIDVVALLRSGQCASGLVERTGDGYVTHAAANWTPSTCAGRTKRR